jgi:hypothetical protein
MFKEEITHLLVNHDKLRPLRNLTLVDEWSPALMPKILAHLNETPKYSPVLSSTVGLLSVCKNVTNVTLRGVSIDPLFISSLGQVTTMRSLGLDACLITTQAMRVLRDRYRSCLQQPLDLHLTPFINTETTAEWDTATTTWSILPCLGSVQSLTVKFPRGSVISRQLADAIRDSNPVVSAKRVCMSGIHPQAADAIVLWMRSATQIPLPLTHLELFAPYGISPDLVSDLLQALQLAPDLETILLGSVIRAPPSLINEIAIACPQLRSLELLYGDVSENRQPVATEWPGSSWEYADSLSAFRRLEHFTWNFLTPRISFSPACMIFLEEGNFVDMSSAEYWQTRDNDYWDDGHLLAAPFAALCPTLQTFTVVNRSFPDLKCEFQRTSTGRVNIKRVDNWRPSGMESFLSRLSSQL